MARSGDFFAKLFVYSSFSNYRKSLEVVRNQIVMILDVFAFSVFARSRPCSRFHSYVFLFLAEGDNSSLF